MKYTLVIFIFGVCSVVSDEIEDHALFYKRSEKNFDRDGSKKEDDTKEMDQRIQNLLFWLQNKYKERTRKAREDLNRMYLPAFDSTTLAPRPFQTFDIDADSISYRPPLSDGADLSNLNPFQPNLNDDNTGSQIDTTYINGNNEIPSAKDAEEKALDVGADNHPPHIHSINAECSKDQMIVNIEFNTIFNGIIYSKGHYNSNECRYVTQNSGKKNYKFTLLLNSCGTQFVDNFAQGEQAYLENILVVQNEPGILEAWDSEHGVRCLWEGKITQSLSSGLNIGSLEQKLVTFNGDTGKASLQIQVGRGPFSYTDQSKVQLGDLMTLVISVEGDPQFNLRIGHCVASSSAGSSVTLTDSNGCPLKEKLMGAFQFTRNPQDGAPIAFAFFKAFKFPDEMDINFECQVELCKVECQTCQKNDLNYEPLRRKRSTYNLLADINDNNYISVNSTIRLYGPKDTIFIL